jgi:D-beta-D-heptose 7-phosphate kinase/D-beta-D-heptose 1-phosphate adenosyltransferase
MTKVVVNGSFDILHVGHIRLLEYARSFPDSYVLVLTDSDRRIKELKGPQRPVNNEYQRTTMLAALKSVDRVEIFDSDQELINYIKDFDPDVMVKGSDYRDTKIIGAEYCKKIAFYERLEKYSTTNTIKDIINRG